MKRFMALLLGVLMLASCAGVASAEATVHSLPEALSAFQGLQGTLDAISAYRREGVNAGFESTSRFGEITQAISAQQAEEEKPNQVAQAGGKLTLSSGIHIIDGNQQIKTVELLNDAVLFNMGCGIERLIIKNSAEYYGLQGSSFGYMTVEHTGHAYLQGAQGEKATVGGRGEVIFLGGTAIDRVFVANKARGGILGEASITNAYLEDNGRIFDINAPEPASQEGDASTGAGGARSGSSRSSQKTAEQLRNEELLAKYPQHIIDWVFNSTPSGTASYNTSECHCGCGCGKRCEDGTCCSKCACQTVKHRLIDTRPACSCGCACGNYCDFGNCCGGCRCYSDDVHQHDNDPEWPQYYSLDD